MLNQDKMPTHKIRLKQGRCYKISGFSPDCPPYYRHKLLAMGLIPESRFRVVRYAPLGDPIEILIKGFHLSLRAKELLVLKIEELA